MNIRLLQPIQDFTHFEEGGKVHWLTKRFNDVLLNPSSQYRALPIKDQAYVRDQVATDLHFAKGGRVKKRGKAFLNPKDLQKQKQSQRQTQIVNIHTSAPRRTRRSAPRKQQQILLPPVFTSVPSGYIHRQEPPTINPMIMNRLDEIELRMRNGFLNQLPGVLGNQEQQEQAASVSSLVQNPGNSKDAAEDLDSQIPQNLNAAASSSSAAASSAKDTGIPWQGGRVYVGANKALIYKSSTAGDEKAVYLSKFVGKNAVRLAALEQLYSELDAQQIEYNKKFTTGS